MARLVPVPYSHPDARRLTRALHADQLSRYGFADDPETTPPTTFDPPEGLFLLVYLGAAAVGCGGVRTRAPGTAEIKHMFVQPATRGHGLGPVLLNHLETWAAERGAASCLLETGVRNREALSLYPRCGYRPIPSYVAGRDPAVNRAFGKQLVPQR